MCDFILFHNRLLGFTALNLSLWKTFCCGFCLFDFLLKYNKITTPPGAEQKQAPGYLDVFSCASCRAQSLASNKLIH